MLNTCSFVSNLRSNMPESPYRGSYLKEATGLLGATLPILGVNVAIYAAFFFAALIWFAAWGGLAFLLGRLSGVAAGFCLLVAIGLGGWAWRFSRRYLLYMVKGAHIAAMTEIMMGRDVPRGLDQLAYGQKIIKKYFKDVAMLFGLDMLVRGIVRRITWKLQRLANWLTFGQKDLRKLIALVRKIVERATSYVDEAILSYTIAQDEKNIFESARKGIILYAQASKPILLSTIKFYVIAKIFSLLVFVGLMIPALALSLFQIEWLVFLGIILAFFGTRLIELAFYEPFALAYMMVTFYRETEHQAPNAEWDQRLQEMSSKFKELTQKARDYSPQPTPQPIEQSASNQPPAW